MMPNGFFDFPPFKSAKKVKSKPKQKILDCTTCALSSTAKSPYMKPFGNFRKKILNVGEAPELTDDLRGKQWQGKAGKLLQRAYKQFGIDLFDDCLNIDAVNCRPITSKGINRTPTPFEISCCRLKVWDVIQKYKPHLIIALGTSSILSLLGNRWKKNLGGVTKWRGWTIPDKDMNAWFCPTYHPSFLSQINTDEIYTIWQQDLQAAFSKLDTLLPTTTDDKKYVHIINTPDELPTFPDIVAFDYETTGLKPHVKGHRIICASVAYNEKEVYSFMMPSSPIGRKRFLDLLKNKIGRAHV